MSYCLNLISIVEYLANSHVKEVASDGHFAFLEGVLGHVVRIGVVDGFQNLVLVLHEGLRDQNKLDSGPALEALQPEGVSHYLVYPV